MHPETKNITQKNIPCLTLTENLELQLSPGLVASYDIQPGNGVGIFRDKTFTLPAETGKRCTKQGMHLIIYYVKKVLLMT